MMVGGWLLAVGIGIRVGRFKQKKRWVCFLVWFGFGLDLVLTRSDVHWIAQDSMA